MLSSSKHGAYGSPFDRLRAEWARGVPQVSENNPARTRRAAAPGIAPPTPTGATTSAASLTQR